VARFVVTIPLMLPAMQSLVGTVTRPKTITIPPLCDPLAGATFHLDCLVSSLRPQSSLSLTRNGHEVLRAASPTGRSPPSGYDAQWRYSVSDAQCSPCPQPTVTIKTDSSVYARVPARQDLSRCELKRAAIAGNDFVNFLKIGIGQKTFEPTRGFLLIDDEVTMDGDVFDPTVHGFNPLPLQYRGARELAETVYGSEGRETLTVRNGKRALTKALINSKRLDALQTDDEEALATVNDLLLSPVLRSVLCSGKTYNFRSRPIVARINRAELGDFDAFVLSSLLIRQFKGQIILPDAGFYLRPFHASLIRENRLMAGVNTLSELDKSGLRDMCLLMDKMGQG
jgi:hypothetical protein